MKVYFHLEEGSAITVLINTENPSYTVQAAIKEFCLEAAKHGKTLEPNGVKLTTKNGKALSASACLCDVASNRDEFWVTVTKEVQKPAPAPVKKEEAKLTPRSEIKRLMKRAESCCKEKQERKAMDIYEEILKLDSQHLDALLRSGDIYLKANRLKKAEKCYSTAQKYHPTELKIQYKLAECYLEMGKVDEVLEILLDYGKAIRQRGGASEQDKLALQVLLCKTYQAKDQKDMAIVLAQGVVRQSREYMAGLVEFARLTYDLGDLQAYEATTVLLTATVMHREDKYIARAFAEACQKPGGLHYLEKTAAESWTSVNALLFMANTLRDNGAVKEAVSLLEHAIELEPNHVPANLLYVHNLEILNEYDKAIGTIQKFLSAFSPLSVDGVSNADVLAALNNETPDPDDVDTSGPCKNLHLLALWFTLVKILFYQNHMTSLRTLVNLLAPLHSDRGLHTTIIRNEAAYFKCIQQVMKCDPLTPVEDTEKMVYFIGDSHCTTPAWRHIEIKGEKHRIRPALCTGTKIWHLRPESVFYPKRTFEQTISSVPEKATVIMCLGEIDCREGLLRAVERCKYENLGKAMDTIVKIYIKLLKELQEKHQWTVLVHPVPPVLDVTRLHVMEFNRRLAERLAAEPHLHWMNFVEELLEGEKLKEEYEFDSTHLHPRYLTLLEEAVTKVQA